MTDFGAHGEKKLREYLERARLSDEDALARELETELSWRQAQGRLNNPRRHA